MANPNSAASQPAVGNTTRTIPPDHIPADCHICGQRAHGLGLQPDRHGDPIRWLCVECSLLLEDIHKIKRMDAYSLKAREGGVEAAAPVIAAYGSELTEYTDEQAAELAGVIWAGCAGRLRELIRSDSPPF